MYLVSNFFLLPDFQGSAQNGSSPFFLMFIFYPYPTPTLSSSPKQHFLNTSGVVLFLCLCSNHLSPPEMPSPFLIYVWLFFQYLHCTFSMRYFPEHPAFNDNALLWTPIVVTIYPLFMPLCIVSVIISVLFLQKICKSFEFCTQYSC